MPWPFLLAPFLLAQTAPAAAEKGAAAPAAAAAAPAAPGNATTKTVTAAPAPASGIESSLPTIIVLGPIFLLFYILLVRPQQQAEKKRKSLVESLKKNDRVFTSSGIYGTVVSVESDQDKVVLRVDDDKGVRMTFSKASILRVVDAKPEKPADATT